MWVEPIKLERGPGNDENWGGQRLGDGTQYKRRDLREDTRRNQKCGVV